MIISQAGYCMWNGLCMHYITTTLVSLEFDGSRYHLFQCLMYFSTVTVSQKRLIPPTSLPFAFGFTSLCTNSLSSCHKISIGLKDSGVSSTNWSSYCLRNPLRSATYVLDCCLAWIYVFQNCTNMALGSCLRSQWINISPSFHWKSKFL